MALNDLKIDQTKDKDYILLTLKDLVPGQSYPVQFRWKRNDGTFGGWSPARTITPPSETVPGTPNVTVNGLTPGMITISWDGKDTSGASMPEVKQIDVYFSGSPFNSTVPAVILTKASTVQQTAPAGQYGVTAYAITTRGSTSVPKIISGGVEVTGIGVVVQPPTLPTGLTAAAAPFALTVNWDGTYSSSTTFTGFKSVDIYATSNASLGSSTTSGLSSSNIVGSLTVDKKTNRINIGLDNLRQAMSLANNTAAYTTDTYLYYVAVNQKDEQYKVGGNVTYTRINSTALRPIQANFVDLASGVISIENLVAGNGSFASWLRTGNAGGARIELSAVNDFSNGGNTVQKGLVAYSSGNTEIFNLDIAAGTLSINGSGTFTGDLSAGSGDSIFKSDSNGIYLGSGSWAGSASTFRVSRSGYLTASSGQIGGIDISASALGSSTFNLSSSGLRLGLDGGTNKNLLISSNGIVHRSGSTATQKFTVDTTTGYVSIYAGNITSSGSTYDGTGVVFDNDGIRAYVKSGSTTTKTIDINSGGSATFSGDISGSTGTFTGGLKTGTLGARVEIPAADGEINLYTSDSTMDPGNINTLSVNLGDGTLNWMALLSPTKSTFGQSNIYLSGGASDTSYIVSNSTKWKHQGRFEVGDVNAVNAFINADGTSRVFSINAQVVDIAGASRYIQLSTASTIRTLISSNGTIYANYLNTTTDGQGSSTGGTTGTAIVQNSSGYLKVSGSSRRFKEDISPISENGYLEAMLKIQPVRFRYINPDFEEPLISGLIAEDLDLIPEFQGVVNYDSGGLPVSISYDRMSSLLVLVLKELKQEFDELKARLDALEG